MCIIYFVIPRHHQAKWSNQLKKAAKGECSIEEIAPELTSGVDVWLLQTWIILSHLSDTKGYTFKIVEHGMPDAISIFHYDHAKPCYGLFNCYPIVVQADRPKVPYSGIRIIQNPAIPQTQRVHYIPLWIQPGLIPRNPLRGTTIERISIPGSAQYLPPAIHSPAFIQTLKDINIKLHVMNAGNWMDYSNTDLILAWRPKVSKYVLNTKPPSKLFNAWHANTPALLGAEPAYQALRKHPDDYFEVQSTNDIIQYIQRMKQHPEEYTRILNHYKIQANTFTRQHIIDKWFSLFNIAQQAKQISTKATLKKLSSYAYRKTYNQLLKHMKIWDD